MNTISEVDVSEDRVEDLLVVFLEDMGMVFLVQDRSGDSWILGQDTESYFFYFSSSIRGALASFS